MTLEEQIADNIAFAKEYKGNLRLDIISLEGHKLNGKKRQKKYRDKKKNKLEPKLSNDAPTQLIMGKQETPSPVEPTPTASEQPFKPVSSHVTALQILLDKGLLPKEQTNG